MGEQALLRGFLEPASKCIYSGGGGGFSVAVQGKGRSPPWAGCESVPRGRQTVSPNPGRLLPLITPICCGIMSVDITLINDVTKLMRR